LFCLLVSLFASVCLPVCLYVCSSFSLLVRFSECMFHCLFFCFNLSLTCTPKLNKPTNNAQIPQKALFRAIWGIVKRSGTLSTKWEPPQVKHERTFCLFVFRFFQLFFFFISNKANPLLVQTKTMHVQLAMAQQNATAHQDIQALLARVSKTFSVFFVKI